MSMVSAIFKCDRDGVESAPSDNGMAPDGWSYLLISGQPAIVSGKGGGDFCAVNTVAVPLPTTPVVMTPPTVQSGNSGNWYDPTTGRYTPPAGRYFLHATVTAALSTGATGITVLLRKNGEPLSAPGIQVAAAGSYSADPANAAIVDANGTDFFDFTCFSNAGASSTLIQFLAMPSSALAAGPVAGNGHLCPGCSAGFQNWMAQGGGRGIPPNAA